MMAEVSAAGYPPPVFWEMTYREVFAVMRGEGIKSLRARSLALWEAWHAANFARAKRIPDLAPLMKKLDPKPAEPMSHGELRQQVIAMAKAWGATVIRRKRGE